MTRPIKFFSAAVLVVAFFTALTAVAGWAALRRADIPYERLEATYADARSRFVDLEGGVRVHYRDQGRPDRPTLVLVHGFTGSLETWEPWVQELGADYRLISLDLPGHGLTRAPADWRPSIEAYTAVLEAFAEAKGLKRFVLVGQSMGGNIAWEYALARPDRLDRLVLVAASGWPDERENRRPPLLELMANPWGRAALRDLENSRLLRRGLEASYQNDAFVTDALVKRYGELMRAPGHRDITLDLSLEWRDRRPATPERLAALRTPTLILHGEEDRLVPVEHARKFQDAIAGSALIVYPETGHILNEEAAARSARDLRFFLEPPSNPAVRPPPAAPGPAGGVRPAAF